MTGGEVTLAGTTAHGEPMTATQVLVATRPETTTTTAAMGDVGGGGS